MASGYFPAQFPRAHRPRLSRTFLYFLRIKGKCMFLSQQTNKLKRIPDKVPSEPQLIS